MILTSPKIRDFRSSELLRQALTEILENPTLKTALEAIKDATTPTDEPAQRVGVPYDSTLAHEFQRLRGAAEALRTLRSMTYAPQTAPGETDAEEDEFDHSLPAHLQLKNKPKPL